MTKMSEVESLIYNLHFSLKQNSLESALNAIIDYFTHTYSIELFPEKSILIRNIFDFFSIHMNLFEQPLILKVLHLCFSTINKLEIKTLSNDAVYLYQYFLSKTEIHSYTEAVILALDAYTLNIDKSTATIAILRGGEKLPPDVDIFLQAMRNSKVNNFLSKLDFIIHEYHGISDDLLCFINSEFPQNLNLENTHAIYDHYAILYNIYNIGGIDLNCSFISSIERAIHDQRPETLLNGNNIYKLYINIINILYSNRHWITSNSTKSIIVQKFIKILDILSLLPCFNDHLENGVFISVSNYTFYNLYRIPELSKIETILLIYPMSITSKLYTSSLEKIERMDTLSEIFIYREDDFLSLLSNISSTLDTQNLGVLIDLYLSLVKNTHYILTHLDVVFLKSHEVYPLLFNVLKKTILLIKDTCGYFPLSSAYLIQNTPSILTRGVLGIDMGDNRDTKNSKITSNTSEDSWVFPTFDSSHVSNIGNDTTWPPPPTELRKINKLLISNDSPIIHLNDFKRIMNRLIEQLFVLSFITCSFDDDNYYEIIDMIDLVNTIENSDIIGINKDFYKDLCAKVSGHIKC